MRFSQPVRALKSAAQLPSSAIDSSSRLRWLIAMGLMAGLFACAPHTDYFETRAFEVTVDLTAEGQRMQITRTIECEPRRRRHGGIKPYTQWRAATKSFGERLPSGAAVMMVTPSFCRSAYRKPGMKGDELPVSQGHIPYIGWADDADNPTVVETYISPDYFKRPDARVRYHGMTARLVSGGSLRKKSDDFEWFENWESLSADETAIAMYARAIPQEIWMTIPVVVAHVRKLNVPTLLPPSLNYVYGKQSNLLYGEDRLRAGNGLTTGPRPGLAYHQGTKLDVSGILSITRTNGRYSISPSAKGYLAFYRIALDSSGQRIAILRLGDTDVRIPVQISGISSVYDPKTSTIFRIASGEITRFP